MASPSPRAASAAGGGGVGVRSPQRGVCHGWLASDRRSHGPSASRASSRGSRVDTRLLRRNSSPSRRISPRRSAASLSTSTRSAAPTSVSRRLMRQRCRASAPRLRASPSGAWASQGARPPLPLSRAPSAPRSSCSSPRTPRTSRSRWPCRAWSSARRAASPSVSAAESTSLALWAASHSARSLCNSLWTSCSCRPEPADAAAMAGQAGGQGRAPELQQGSLEQT
mmetsp:Transcript_112889/g.364393  ORF Transcript_112889/g.364393 Transcript_112889/m.364393 type:complete len:225 (+) Transcript_112889:239-913(+)